MENSANSEKPFGWRTVALLTILVLLARIPFLFFHYADWDEALFMAESWAMTKGQVLFKDIYFIHPGLTLSIMVPFFYLVRPEWVPLAIKTMNLSLVLVGALLIGRLAFEWLASRPLSLLGALLFIFYCSALWAQSAYAEFYAIFPILLSVWSLYFTRKAKLPISYLAGGLWGVAFFFKQSAIFDAIGLYLGYLYLAHTSRKSKAAATGLMVLGFASVTAVVSIYFLYHAALPEAWRSIFVRSLIYAHLGREHWSFLTDLANGVIGGLWLSLFVAILGAICVIFDEVICVIFNHRVRTNSQRPSDASFFQVLLIWFCADLVGLCTIGRFYEHYLLQLVPQASLLPLFILNRVQLRVRRAIVGVIAAGFLALTVVLFAVRMRSIAETNWAPWPVQQSTAVADYIKKHTRDDDRIFLYKTKNLDIFFLSQRLSNNGIYTFFAMEAETMHDQEHQDRKRKEFLQNLPAIIVVDPAWRSGQGVPVSFFEEALKKYYLLDTTLKGLQIYSRVSH